MARTSKSTNGANLGFEQTLWALADKLRGHMDAAEYKHVVLGLIFLKYISDAFQERYDALKAEKYADPEDRDEYTAENVFWVPKEARWSFLQAKGKQPTIHNDLHKDLRADFILANPPFNMSDWGGERLRNDARWKYGAPPVGNANFA